MIEYVGEVIDRNKFWRRLEAKQVASDEAYYFLTLDNSRKIDAGPSAVHFIASCMDFASNWKEARYIIRESETIRLPSIADACNFRSFGYV